MIITWEYLLIVVVVILFTLLLGWPQRKQLPECPGLEGPDKQIEKIRENYINGSIDQETFERALDDVFNDKPNSYGEAIYDPTSSIPFPWEPGESTEL